MGEWVAFCVCVFARLCVCVCCCVRVFVSVPACPSVCLFVRVHVCPCVCLCVCVCLFCVFVRASLYVPMCVCVSVLFSGCAVVCAVLCLRVGFVFCVAVCARMFFCERVVVYVVCCLLCLCVFRLRVRSHTSFARAASSDTSKAMPRPNCACRNLAVDTYISHARISLQPVDPHCLQKGSTSSFYSGMPVALANARRRTAGRIVCPSPSCSRVFSHHSLALHLSNAGFEKQRG